MHQLSILCVRSRYYLRVTNQLGGSTSYRIPEAQARAMGLAGIPSYRATPDEVTA